MGDTCTLLIYSALKCEREFFFFFSKCYICHTVQISSLHTVLRWAAFVNVIRSII